MSNEDNLHTAHSMKAKSRECRKLGLSLPVGEQRAFNLHVQLLHAANAFSLWQDSSGGGDYHLMIEFTENLEEAALAYSLK